MKLLTCFCCTPFVDTDLESVLPFAEALKKLLEAFPNLAMTTDLLCTTALHTAATQGHIDVVNLLLKTNSHLAKIAKNNGKTALHSAARMGHVEVVKSLIGNDASIGFRTDKKGQTALHMAVKGQNEGIVLELVKPDPAVLSVENNKGSTPLHVATIKGRTKVAAVASSLLIFSIYMKSYKLLLCLLHADSAMFGIICWNQPQRYEQGWRYCT